MPILELFRANPFTGLALGACLGAILWCIVLLPRLGRGHERFLVASIGLMAVFEGLRLLKDAGIWKPAQGSAYEEAAKFIVCCLYLAALLVVQVFGAEHRRTKLRLRLSEMNEAPMVTASHPDLQKKPNRTPPAVA